MDGRGRSRQLIWWPLASTLGALLLGAGAAAAVVLVLRARHAGSDSWEAVGYFVFGLVVGLFVGCVVTAVAWVLGLVAVAWKLFPRGQRAAVVAVAALAAVVPGILIGFVGQAASGGGGWLLWLYSSPLALGPAPFVFRWWDRRVGPAAGGPVWPDAPWVPGGGPAFRPDGST